MLLRVKIDLKGALESKKGKQDLEFPSKCQKDVFKYMNPPDDNFFIASAMSTSFKSARRYVFWSWHNFVEFGRFGRSSTNMAMAVHDSVSHQRDALQMKKLLGNPRTVWTLIFSPSWLLIYGWKRYFSSTEWKFIRIYQYWSEWYKNKEKIMFWNVATTRYAQANALCVIILHVSQAAQ